MKWLASFCAILLSLCGLAAAQVGWDDPAPATLNFDGKAAAAFQYSDLSITIDSEPVSGGTGRLPFVVARYKGQPAFSIHLVGDEAQGSDEPFAELRIMRLDLFTTVPQVIFTYYWQGAHCCTVTKIATIDSAGIWHVVSGGVLDGEGYRFRDLDDDDGRELISVDNSFLYAFGCYACSYPPTRIHKLVGSELKDVTANPKYQSYLRQQLVEMERAARSSGDSRTRYSNGYLAGWVAAKALVGELPQAWHAMLSSYERNSDWPIQECLIAVPLDKCPESKLRQIPFPEALAMHLVKNNYITMEERQKLSTETTLSPQLRLCTAAVQDPLRPMIIDTMIAGGKHITPNWTNSFKNDLETDYGSFLTVLNDVTVERANEHTGKIGCAVTYQIDLQGLTTKVLQEGATARAQTLIRQMAQKGKTANGRLLYTVEETSGHSLMVWFGLH